MEAGVGRVILEVDKMATVDLRTEARQMLDGLSDESLGS